MQHFTPDELMTRRARFTEAGYPKLWLGYGGREYLCFLLPANLCPPDLPNAVMQCTPPLAVMQTLDRPQDYAFFAVSDGVPERLRRYCLLHEIMEFMDIGCDSEHSCAEASDREIAMVTEDESLTAAEKRDYIRMRWEFFRNLIAYATANRYDEDDICKFGHSLAVFERTLGIFAA